MKSLTQFLPAAILVLFAAFSLANAQTPTTNKETVSSVAAATEEVKTNTTELLQFQQEQLTKAEAKLDELRGLVDDGLVARVELDQNEQSLASLRAEVEATRNKIAEAQQLLTKIQTEKELAQKQAALAKSTVKLVSKPYAFSSGSNILRFSGTTSWSLATGLAGVRSFFATSFNRALPTSAIGQSATHNHLGYNHSNAVDVALHPDSVEGRSLINYLQIQGIPFLAFRTAIPGVATGPHIHIGSPSHRL